MQFADWDFIDSGQDICSPDAAVLTSSNSITHILISRDVSSQILLCVYRY